MSGGGTEAWLCRKKSDFPKNNGYAWKRPLCLDGTMKKLWFIVFGFILPIVLVSCGQTNTIKDIELMGAGDRIHDSYTFANVGTKIKDDGENKYTIFGSVDKLDNLAVKEEFEIAEDINHVVVIKLSAIESKVIKDEVEITVNGVRNYDAEHLNGSSYTFIILEAKQGATVSIGVKWNKSDEVKNYIVNFASDLELK